MSFSKSVESDFDDIEDDDAANLLLRSDDHVSLNAAASRAVPSTISVLGFQKGEELTIRAPPSFTNAPPAVNGNTVHGQMNPEEPLLALVAQVQANAFASSSSSGTNGAHSLQEGMTETDTKDSGSGMEVADGASGDADKPSQAKKQRVRLAQACDRCRRRKIKCDTQLPCTPCQAARELCQFETPARKIPTKRRAADAVEDGESGTGLESVSGGTGMELGPEEVGLDQVGQTIGLTRDSAGRPIPIGGPVAGHAQPQSFARPRQSQTSSGTGSSTNINASGTDPSNRCIDLTAFEAILRNVSPSIHNALISQLDASLAKGGSADVNGGALNEGAERATPTFSFTNGMTVPGGFDFGGMSGDGIASGSLSSGLARQESGTAYTPQQYMAQASRSDTNSSHIFGRDVRSVVHPSFATTAIPEDDGVDASSADLERALGGLNLSNGYLYLDEIGQTKWQGATSGFPLLDLLTGKASGPAVASEEDGEPVGQLERKPSNPLRYLHSHLAGSTPASRNTDGRRALSPESARGDDASDIASGSNSVGSPRPTDPATKRRLSTARTREKFFPDRQPRKSQPLNPEETWKIITNVIPPDLMDTLVRCYISTSHLLWPFLHVPSFLADYANPQKWAEPGFACFVVAICTLSSRHVDDPRVRAKINDASTAGKAYFELFKRLRDLPSADRPTLYSIQAAYLVAIYAFGLGTLSKAFALLAESVTLCLDGGLHRSVEGYEFFTPIEQEMRKRTFWSIYSWDKQSAALFGKPPLIHLRDCDVPEPLQVDDEYITETEVIPQPEGSQTRLSAFVAVVRLHVVLEGVIDACVTPATFASSPFLSRAASTISRRPAHAMSLAEAETLLEEWIAILPKHWRYDAETVESKDPVRITQAERLHCLQHLVKMIINRQRFSGFVHIPAATPEERTSHLEYCKKAMDSALTICANHVHISQRGMMTYFGVHVIHSLAQCGRTLVAVILNCKTADFAPLIAPATEGLRSCVGLLRRFSGRYLCGLRSADILEEFCRVCNISVDLPSAVIGDGNPSPAWLRPLRRRVSRSPGPAATSPPVSITEEPRIDLSSLLTDALDNPASANALLSTQDFFDLSAAASPTVSGDGPSLTTFSRQEYNSLDALSALGPATAPFDQFETLAPDAVMMDVSAGGIAGEGDSIDQDWDVPFASGNDALGQMSAEMILQMMQQGTFSASLQNYA